MAKLTQQQTPVIPALRGGAETAKPVRDCLAKIRWEANTRTLGWIDLYEFNANLVYVPTSRPTRDKQ